MRSLLIPALVLLAACEPSTDPMLEELEANQTLWADQGSDDYEWTVQQLCFCPFTQPIDVTVVGGEVTEAIRQPETTGTGPETLDPSEYEDWFVVEGLFEIAEAAIEGADEVTVTYDPDLGYPTAIEIDWMTNAMDDEASYFASGLVLSDADQ